MRDRLRSTTALVLVVALAYAVVRYVVFGTTPPARIPVFIGNKAIPVAALFLLGLSLVLPKSEERARAGHAGLWASVLHLVLSQVIAGPVYFPKLHGADGALTVLGELSMLAGAIALVLLAMIATRTRGWSARSALLVRLVVAAVAAHAAAIGAPSWTALSTWPGGLPPISLLSFLGAIGALVAAERARLREHASSLRGGDQPRR